MKILFITIACRNNKPEPDFLLPLQLFAMAGDILEAGHKVYWLEESLNYNNQDKLTNQALQINPDVVFFACSSTGTRQLMAKIAVKTDSKIANQYISADIMRPADSYRDTFTSSTISVERLLQKITAANQKSFNNTQDQWL